MTGSTAGDIMKVLLQDAGAARAAALGRLKHACDELERRGPIRLAAIEFFLKSTYGKAAGPRAQSISNERTRAVGMYHYVAARNRERVIPERERRSKIKGNLVHQIETIQDMDLRIAMRDVYDQMNIAKAHLLRAKHLLKTVRPGLDVDAVLAGRGQPGSQLVDEISLACLQLIHQTLHDDIKLKTCGLSNDHGAVQRRTGTRDELFAAPTLATLAALVEALSAT